MFRKFLVASLSVNALFAACCDPITREQPWGRYENNFYVEGDFLYWLAKQEGNQYASTGIAITVPGTVDPTLGNRPAPIRGPGKVYEPKTRMEPGFRAGAGLNFAHDNWDFFLE